MRNFLALLDQAGLADMMGRLYPDAPLAALWQISPLGVRAPLSSSAGRLFGAFAAALGLVPGVQSHQGEAAVRLECLAMQVMEAVPPYRMTLGAVVDTGPLFRAWATDLAKGVSPDTLAARFRADVAQVFAATARDHPHSGPRGQLPCLAGAFRTPRCLQ